jgi:cell shape-determining protein MreC
MQQNFSQKSSIFFITTTFCMFSFWNISFGKTMNFEQTPIPPMTLIKDVQQNHEPYIKDVHQQIQKSRKLLNDLTKMRTQATSEERKEELYAPVMKLTKELEHAERVAEHLNVNDPKGWQRNKTEMDAVLADLEVTYNNTSPLLNGSN